jgi:SAM-dependent methyltransferase
VDFDTGWLVNRRNPIRMGRHHLGTGQPRSDDEAEPRPRDTAMRERVVEANLRFYGSLADDYFSWRSTDAFNARYDPLFERGFAQAAGRPVRALDCCAGTGLVTRLLLDAGCEVTSVDISPEMLAKMREHALRPGDSVRTLCAEITEFLATTDETWELAVFGSAVHHLWNFDEAISLALDRVVPGGGLWLIAEPVLQPTRRGRAVRSLELWVRRFSRSPREILAGARRRLSFIGSKARTGPAPAASVGFYAEVYSGGLDFERIEQAIASGGASITWREAGISGPRAIQLLKRITPGYLGDSCSLVARRLA